jgi:hypothetical protein
LRPAETRLGEKITTNQQERSRGARNGLIALDDAGPTGGFKIFAEARRVLPARKRPDLRTIEGTFVGYLFPADE